MTSIRAAACVGLALAAFPPGALAQAPVVSAGPALAPTAVPPPPVGPCAPVGWFVHAERPWIACADGRVVEAQPPPPPPSTPSPTYGWGSPATPADWARAARRQVSRGERLRRRIAPTTGAGLEAGLAVRGTLGGARGVVADAHVGWRARRAPVSARIVADPLGVARVTEDFDEPRRTRLLGGVALVGLDHRLVGLSAGIGLGRIRIEGDRRRTDGLAASLALEVRLGAADGLHLMARTQWTSIDGEATLAGTRVQLQIPTADAWIVLRGGGGPTGEGFGEVGYRVALGDDADGVRLTPSLGAIVIGDAGGVLLGLGVELRP